MNTKIDNERNWDAARRRTILTARLTAVAGALAIPAMAVPALLLTRSVGSGRVSYPVLAAFMTVLCLPLIVAIWRLNDRQMRRSNREVRRAGEQLRELLDRANADAETQHAETRQKEFETELANALEMAEGESEVLQVVEQAFALARPDDPVELLLADNSHAHLIRMAGSPAVSVSLGESVSFGESGRIAHHCPVESPDQCPAARRGQVQRFPDSTRLGACPKLRAAGEEPCSAVCVPVSIMGRTVGVVHATGSVGEPVAETAVAALNTVASLAGARLGMIRMVAEVELQAATDSLTGLLNRRAFEKALTTARKGRGPVAVAMADLDHFKALNDTYGHETGDRALRVFAQTLKSSVRAGDLVGRHGGEEFVVALPDCPIEAAGGVFEGVRAKVEASAGQAGLPQFTVSIGVVELEADEDLPTALARADQALFEAKAAGRNRVVQQAHNHADHSALSSSTASRSAPTESPEPGESGACPPVVWERGISVA